MPEEIWDGQLEYLRNSRFLYHNDDYLEFLVKKVWHLDNPCKIVDFGCGYGFLGIENIGCRVSDCVICLFPSMEPEHRRHLHEALSNEGLGLAENYEETKTSIRDRLLGYGISPEIVDAQMRFETQMDFRHKGENYHTVFPGLMTWSYGTARKVAAT